MIIWGTASGSSPWSIVVASIASVGSIASSLAAIRAIRYRPRPGTPIRGLNREVLFTDEVLGSIGGPTKFAWGTADPFGGADTARAFAARTPGAELELLDGMGHAPWIDDPERCAAIATSFLDP